MSQEQHSTNISTLRDYLRVIRRRKWIVLQVLVMLPAAAILLSLWQKPLYEGTAEVLLSRQNLAASLTGATDPAVFQEPDRIAQTQAELASVPLVAGRVLRELDLDDRTAGELLEMTTIEARDNADLLQFRVRDRDAELAARLATEYGNQYISYRQELDTAGIRLARDGVRERIESLEATNAQNTPGYASLVDKEQQLQTLEALQTANAFVVRPADIGAQVQPRPVRDAMLAVAFAVVLAIALAFLWEALDTRIRSGDEIVRRLGLPLLGRLPPPPRELRLRNELLMLTRPNSAESETFRMLRTNVDFANLDRSARTVMVTSAGEQEGKSTSVANLAVALARAGRSVLLVDLDLRRPVIARFFGLTHRAGLTDVALGEAKLEDAIHRIPLTGPTLPAPRTRAGAEHATGSLEVLPAGPVPPDPGEFVGTAALAELLQKLRDRAEIVLIDAPPVLHVNDAMALSAKVDALIVVVRLKLVRRPMLDELARTLESTPTRKLGIVLTGAESMPGYGYGRAYEPVDETRKGRWRGLIQNGRPRRKPRTRSRPVSRSAGN